MSARIAVVSAGLRSPSSTRLLADQLAAAVTASLHAAGTDDVAVTTVELRELAHEVTDALLTGFPTGRLAAAVKSVLEADGLVAVSPVFSASYGGLFKSFFDVLEPDVLREMPVLLAATGGTERHSLVLEFALRPLFVYLGAAPVGTAVYAATADFGGDGAARLNARVSRSAGELAAAVLGRRGRHGAAAGAQASTDELVPFADLLAETQDGQGR
ncbi:MAG: NAD(P)H-dependent oxidoreductase [Chloroflexi bacterium]|nr:NAD(P)H-dependent oxidoreductase [Chloroflexota bacterium]